MEKITPDIGVEARLRGALEIHFDPTQGAPYWLDRARELGFDPHAEIKCVADLSRLGTMDPKSLAHRSLEAFLPRPLLDRRSELIIGQTGGTLGRPVWTAYLETEFQEAFVTPFLVAAEYLGFPANGTWLYAGPSGPHIIARAADAIARASGATPPFGIDFDPRWAGKLATGSFAAERYLRHIVDQALTILESQRITVLFSTPVVIRALADVMRPQQRDRILGVHYGGMAIASSEMRELQTEAFPNAIHLSGYGNTLFGCCLELSAACGRTLTYYPYGDRILFGVLDGSDEMSGCPDYGRSGMAGRLVFSRLDQTMLLVNVVERDDVTLREPPADAPGGFRLLGVESPLPRASHRNISSVSLY